MTKSHLPCNCPVDLKSFVQDEVKKYLDQLADQLPSDLYAMVLSQVEAPLLQQVMAYCRENQTQAARILGISRTTLKKKLMHYHIIHS